MDFSVSDGREAIPSLNADVIVSESTKQVIVAGVVV